MDKYQIVNTLLYESDDDGAVSIKVVIDEEKETMWATQKTISGLFDVSKSTISEHIKHIFEEGELNKNSTVRKIRTVQIEGNREVKRQTTFYNLDEYQILNGPGKVSRKVANEFVKREFEKFKPIHDKNYKSDYNKFEEKTRKFLLEK